MKQFFTLLLVSIAFVGCKPTSDIVTSKYEAQKRGIYTAPQARVAVRSNSNSPIRVSNTSVSKKSETKKLEKRRNIEDRNEDDYLVTADNSSYMVKQLINAAEENLGADYRTGGTTPDGYDCSGLMYSTFKKFDITLPRSSNDMAKVGRKLDNTEIKKGDLVFFKTNGKSSINHVGMVTEVADDEIKFIHSSTQKGVIISSTKEAYYEKTFAQANRILE